MRLSTAITRLLGIDHPVLLAPMGGVSGGALDLIGEAAEVLARVVTKIGSLPPDIIDE